LRISFALFLFASITLSSCNLFTSNGDLDTIARVGEKILVETDIPKFTNKESGGDSLAQRKSFIDNWVKEKLLLQKALDNLSENSASFETQLENYRNSLLIYTFENQLINQKLDTLVGERELKKYYKLNVDNFKLRQDVTQSVFVATLNSAPSTDSLKHWMYEDFDYYKEDLVGFCSQFALACHLDTLEWIPLAKIKEIGKLALDKNLNLTIGENLIQDSLRTMYINSFAIRMKGEVAPFSWVKEELKSIILNKRKIELIAKVKQEIFESATLKKEYEVYE
jgi:uncharacterized protein YnzC (UPF0291/DUF896 family)